MIRNDQNKIENKILYRHIPMNFDKNIIDFFLKSNKHLFEIELFYLNIIGTWNCISYIEKKELVVNITFFPEVGYNISWFNDIFKKIISKSEIPKYDKFVEFITTRKSGYIMDKVLQYIDEDFEKENVKKISREGYYNQVNFLKEILLEGFNESFTVSNKIVKSKYNNLDCLQTIDKGTLAFMGIYIKNNYNVLYEKQNIILKILEKYLGDNDTDSIYFKFREQGKIYTGVSNYITTTKTFITGIIGSYSDELWDSVLYELRGIEINEQRLYLAKEKLINEIKYLIFEYGERCVLEPYIKHIGVNIDKEDVYSLINEINVDITKNFLKESSIKKIKVGI